MLVFLTGLLLAFTPLRELIPGYTNPRMVRQTYENARIIDSLETQLKAQEDMLADIQSVMLGKDPAEQHENASRGSTKRPGEQRQHGDTLRHGEQKITYHRSKEDSLLREEVEQREAVQNP